MASKSIKLPDQSERALRTLLYAMLIGVLAVAIYAVDSSGWTRFVNILATGLVVAAAALLIGGLLGFLFGIPRTLQQTSSPAPTTGSPGNQSSAVSSSGTNLERAEYQANTNLEQISDWLTKMLVGVGLIQVREIGEKLLTLSAAVARAVGDTTGNRSFALSLILFYVIVGFLFAYLWTRLYLPGAFRKADRAEIEQKLQFLNTKVEQADIRSRDAQATSLGTGKGDTDEVKKRLLEVADVEAENSQDPWKGRFGGKNSDNDRQLQAEVKPIPGSQGLYAIRLKVSSLHPDPNPLKGAVQFFLHPTFNNEKPVVTVGPNGVAELNLKAWGAFTVGAIADDGQTKLELDLSELETAPSEFRSR